MKADVVLLARAYCGVAAALLIGFGLSAWSAAEDAATAGIMTFGVGLFVLFGMIAKLTRLLAIVIVCGLFAVFAFIVEFVRLAWHGEPPGTEAMTRWIFEATVALISWKLSRTLFEIATA